MIFSIFLRACNRQIMVKKKQTEFSFEAITSEVRFHTNLGLGNLTPSVNNPNPKLT